VGFISRPKYKLYYIEKYIGGIGYQNVEGIKLAQIYSGGLL
jgi:hypothetical protein